MRHYLAAILMSLTLAGCMSGENLPTSPRGHTGSVGPESIPAWYSKTPTFYAQFRSAVTVSRPSYTSGPFGLRRMSSTMILTSTGEPDHCSVYFCEGMVDPRDPCDPRWCLPPLWPWTPVLGKIEPQGFEFEVPVVQQLWSDTRIGYSHATETGCGPIGIAINGVALFDQHDAEGEDAATESVHFDTFNGHPTPDGIYHYHTNPIYLTVIGLPDGDPTADPARLVGVMLDGIPLYGPADCDGSTPVLERFFHGHYGPTPDDPSGRTWHYHVTLEAPYFVGRYKGKVLGKCLNTVGGLTTEISPNTPEDCDW